jgi:hypothetical protein
MEEGYRTIWVGYKPESIVAVEDIQDESRIPELLVPI